LISRRFFGKIPAKQTGSFLRKNYEFLYDLITKKMKERIQTEPHNVSINTDPKSPFWFCSFTGPDGQQKRRSTKVPVGGGLFRGEKLSAKQAEKRALLVGAQLAEAEYQEHHTHDNTTVREHLNNYFRRVVSRLSPSSHSTNRTAFRRLCEWLGKRADQPLRMFTKGDAKQYLEMRRKLCRATTVTREACCFKVAFEDAIDLEIIGKNPWRGIRIPADRGEEKLRSEPFTLDEIKYIIENFPAEWSSAVRCSFETFGQRLGDIRKLKWEQFDWERRVVRFITGKNDKVLEQPMRPQFFAWARAQYEAGGCNDDAFLHPRLARETKSISGEFSLLLEKHGIGRRQDACLTGNRKGQRTKTFHSVRRAAATLIHASGFSETMAMKLVGHKSIAVHEVYVKPDTEQLRAMVERMPDV